MYGTLPNGGVLSTKPTPISPQDTPVADTNVEAYVYAIIASALVLILITVAIVRRRSQQAKHDKFKAQPKANITAMHLLPEEHALNGEVSSPA